MPTIVFSFRDLCNLAGKELDAEELKSVAHLAKAEIENFDEKADEMKVNFEDTNLPYLWSVEGFARFLRGYYHLTLGVPKLKVEKKDYELIVEKSAEEIRPFISCFAAKGREIDDYMLKQMIQLQEKFCDTYGRHRQKASIGLYSYKRIKFPLVYRAVEPESIKFVPLEFKARMNLKEILAEHPKGKDYAYILENFEKYPVLMDSKDDVLSFIPIINSDLTGRLEPGDQDIFFEATGTDEEAVNLAAVIFAYAFHDRGFDIYSVDVRKGKGHHPSPDFKLQEIKISKDHIKKLFGLELEEKEIKHLLERSQYSFDDFKVNVPSYRADVLHPYDVIEDIGIIYGFDNIKERPLQSFTIGSTIPFYDFIDKVRDLIVGLGFQEIMSPILSNKELLCKKMEVDDTGIVEIQEYMSETYSAVRSWILPIMMDVLSKNKHSSFPQKIFEEGIVNTLNIDHISDFHRIAVAVSHEESDYTEIRQVLDYLIRSLGLKVDYEEAEHNSFIIGRCARAIVKGKKVAYLGEINPKVLENFGLEMPVAALELNLTELYEAMKK